MGPSCVSTFINISNGIDISLPDCVPCLPCQFLLLLSAVSTSLYMPTRVCQAGRE
jgi:hypothetical protein